MTKCLNPSCNKSVKQTPGKRRRDYCSNACRQQAHYRRSGKTKITLIQDPDGLWSVQDPDGTVRKCRLEWVTDQKLVPAIAGLIKDLKKAKLKPTLIHEKGKTMPINSYLAKRRGLKNGEK